MRHTTRLLIIGLLWLATQDALGSYFVPIDVPDDWDLSSLDVDADGNYAYIISRITGEDANGDDIEEGTLYHNGAPYVGFGPNEDYTLIRQFVVAGSKVIFTAQVRRIDNGDSPCGGFRGYFDGPNPPICGVQRPPILLRGLGGLDDDRRPLAANRSGDFLTTSEPQAVNWRIYSPRQGFLLNPNFWVAPTWSVAPAGGGTIRIYSVLKDGRMAILSDNCLEVYSRGPLQQPSDNPYQGLLTQDSQSCISEGLTGGATIFGGAINRNSGDLAFCASPNGPGGMQSVYLVSPGTAPVAVIADLNGCDVVGSDAAGNVVYRQGGQVFWSNTPDEPVLSAGHAFSGKILSDVSPLAVTGDQTIVALATLRDPPAGDDIPVASQFGLFFSDGDTDFPPDPNDPPEDELVWTNNSGGSFSTSTNWDAGEVPNSTQVAVFDSSAGYAVQFDDAAQQTLRLKVEQGDVDFVTGSINVLQDSLTKPGVVVATGARLDVESGHTLESIYATVGQDPAGSAGPGVLGVSGDSVLTTQARLIVGGAGKGQLSITAGGTALSGSARIGNDAGGEGIAILEGAAGAGGTSGWDTGNLSVGYNGLGELRVLDGAVLGSDDVYFGNLGVGRGVGVVADGFWVLGSLVVGHRGMGELSVADIGSVTIQGDFHSGNSNGSFGDTLIASRGVIEVDQSVYLGVSGIGNLVVESGGRLTADDLHIGFYNDGDGDLTVRGAAGTIPEQFSEVTLAGGLIVGAQGIGFALFDDRAVVQSDYGVIGGSAEGTGTVTIRNDAGWDIGTTLYVGTASDGLDPNVCDDADISYGVGRLELMGGGQLPDVTGQDLFVTGPESSITGTGTIKFATRLEQCAKIAPGNSPGTLTIDGDLDFRGGVLEVELSGLSNGQYDVLQVTGDADLSGGIVKFIFDGFLPQQGDQITFLETGGTLTLNDNMRYEYQGANDGFEFEVTTDAEGNITFTANNDAIDLLFGSGFES